MVTLDITYFFQMINFLVLFLLLRKFLFKPVMDYLDKRNEYVQNSLKEAENKLKDATDLHEEYKKEMANAKREGREIIERASSQGEATREEILKEAKEESEKIMNRARDEIEREKEKVLSELREEVANLSVTIASKILKEKMDEEVHGDLVEKFIGEVGSGSGSSKHS